MSTGGQPSSLVNRAGLPGSAWFVFDSRATDVARILASAAIFYYHIGLFGGYPLFRFGEYAVEYFVILSGVSFVLFSQAKPARPSEYWDYLKKRFRSLFPMYLLINLLVFLASFVHAPARAEPVDLPGFLASVAGVSGFLGWHFMTKPMWFIPFIMQVYLLLPLLDWTLRRVNPMVVVLLAAAFSFLLALWAMDSFQLTDLQRCNICKNWSPLFRLPEVCVGVILGRMMQPGSSRRWPGVAAILLYGLLAWLAGLPQRGIVFTFFYLPWNGFLVPLILFGLTLACVPVFAPLGTQWLRLLGLSTFPFFLLQCAPLAIIKHAFGDRLVVWLILFLACWLMAIACTVAVAKVVRLWDRIWHPAPTVQ
jgi:peptidoglycan/LPS O-acetylase OafA/YrhL